MSASETAEDVSVASVRTLGWSCVDMRDLGSEIQRALRDLPRKPELVFVLHEDPDALSKTVDDSLVDEHVRVISACISKPGVPYICMMSDADLMIIEKPDASDPVIRDLLSVVLACKRVIIVSEDPNAATRSVMEALRSDAIDHLRISPSPF